MLQHRAKPRRSDPRPLIHILVADLACIVEAVLPDVFLDVRGEADCPTLGAAVWGLVCVDALVGPEAALVGQCHHAQLTDLKDRSRN